MPIPMPVVVLAAMFVLSICAALLLPRHVRVPMQWGVGGNPTWTAPVWLAVSFTPLLALGILGSMLWSNDGLLVETVVPSLAMLFLVIHAAHLFFAVRSVSSNRN